MNRYRITINETGVYAFEILADSPEQALDEFMNQAPMCPTGCLEATNVDDPDDSLIIEI